MALRIVRFWLCKFGAMVGQLMYNGIRYVKRIIFHSKNLTVDRDTMLSRVRAVSKEKYLNVYS